MSTGAVDDAFSFDAHSGNQYANVNGGLAIASVSGLNVYNADGTERTVLQSAMTTPNIQSAGDLALAYDAGGYSLLTAGKGSGAKLDVTTAKPLLDADLSPDGYVCYSTSESGYKSVLYVCNPSGTTVYRWLSSSQYLPTCTVSKGGAYLAAVALGQENGILRAASSYSGRIPRRSTAVSRSETSCSTIWNFWTATFCAPSAKAAACG